MNETMACDPWEDGAMTYEIVLSDSGETTGVRISVKKQSDLMSAARNAYLGHAEKWTIRHHDMYSQLFFDGRAIYDLNWVTE